MTTPDSAPVIVAQRLRKGSCGSPRGADRLFADAITTRRLPGLQHQKLLVRADSAFYGRPSIHTAIKAGAGVSVTARMTRNIRHAITTIPDTSWEAIEYTDALFDENTQRWNSSAEVAEVPFTAFASKPEADQVPGRLVVRRIPELNNKNVDQLGLFDLHCFHAVIDQVNADLKNSALAHMPSGKFTANASAAGAGGHAFNFTRTAGTIAAGSMARATTATIRHRIVAAPARVARRSRRLVLHLPECWKWESQWRRLFAHGHFPPVVVSS